MKEQFKNYLYVLKFKKKLRSLNFDGIIVASSGRAGSTYLFDKLVGYHANALGGTLSSFKKVATYFQKDLNAPIRKNHKVIKTHSLPPSVNNTNYYYIFIHGDPLESVLSSLVANVRYGDGWLKMHQQNLGGNGKLENILNEDVLNFERQIVDWSEFGRDCENVLLLPYELLPGCKDELEAKTGISLDFSDFRIRKNELAYGSPLNVFHKLREIRKNLKL